MWTKRQIIEHAFAELALAGWVYDLAPEELQAALRTLDLMMATWLGKGLTLGYVQGVNATESTLNQASGVAMTATEAVALNLAVRLAAGKGKMLLPTTTTAARDAFDALMSASASAAVMQQPYPSGTPRGAGRKPWRSAINPYLPKPNTDALQNAADGDLSFTGTNT